MLNKLELYGIALLVLILGTAGGYLLGNIHGHHAEALELVSQQAKEDAAIQKGVDKALGVAAAAIAGIQVHNQTIVQKATDTIREVPVYQDCKNTDAVKELILESRKAP